MNIHIFLLFSCSLAFERRAYVTIVTDEDSLNAAIVQIQDKTTILSIQLTTHVLFYLRLGLKNGTMLSGKSINCVTPSQIQTVIKRLVKK